MDTKLNKIIQTLKAKITIEVEAGKPDNITNPISIEDDEGKETNPMSID